MKLINFKITARFTIKTTKLNVKIHYESAEVCHIRVSYFGLESFHMKSAKI